MKLFLSNLRKPMLTIAAKYEYNIIMTQNSLNRTKGVVAASVGFACNLLLAAAKIVLGFLSGMVSVIADGFNNVGDCGSGAVSLVSVCIAAKPADKVHPYGHRRAEYVASLVTGFLVLAVAVGLLKESVQKIIDGLIDVVTPAVYIVLGVSVAIKAAMFVYYRVTAAKINSDSVRAAAIDSLCDCVATAAVIVGAVCAEFGVAADGWAGIAVVLFVGWQGVKLVKEASSKLLGQAPDSKQVQRIKSLILSYEGVLGLHDLHVFGYGDGVNYATVHIEMDAELPALRSHAVLDEIEHDVLLKEGVRLTAHLDPVNLQDGEAVELEKSVRQVVRNIADGVEIHDFRLIRGAVDRLVFDAGVPFDCKQSDSAILQAIEQAVRTLGDYDLSVTVERE